eukprot:TRINITY_DN28275_c0_g1_i1.p1 TRINITY_DN28275_c0_g1~~TRINITY_DN28275_c0_g1_i1.p1  ORF type:complete len:333 (+),score=114.28 TRINITY_DN28275_c0_g1_i1:49-1047(+)
MGPPITNHDFNTYPRVNFRSEYDAAELKRFYESFMKVNFPIEDELDPLEVWEDVLDPEKKDPDDEMAVHMHVVVVYEPSPPSTPASERAIVGGVVFEYYKMSNCCLMSYFAVAEAYRGAGLGRWLVATAHQTCVEEADAWKRSVTPGDDAPATAEGWLRRVSRLPDTARFNALVAEVAGMCTDEEVRALAELMAAGHDVSASLSLFFAETNAEGVDDGVLDPKIRHRVLHKLGFNALEFSYIQPPLSDTQQPCYDLLLATLARAPATPPPTVPALLVKAFLLDFAVSVYGCVASFTDAGWWKQIAADLAARGGIVPQIGSPPWEHRTVRSDA